MTKLSKIWLVGFLLISSALGVNVSKAEDIWIPGSNGGVVSSDTTLGDDVQLQFGDTADAACEYDTSVAPDSLVCGVGADSNIFYVAEKADIGTNWNKSAQTNPTLCIQSADASSVTKRICLYHDQTNGVIDVDSGGIRFADDVIFSGAMTLSAATASRVVFTDASKNFVYTSTSSVVAASLSDETGSGSLVFGTSPTIGTPVISGGTIDGTTIGDTTVASGSFSTVSVKNGSNTIVNAINTDPDVFSGDLVQVQFSANGGGTITGSSDAYRLIRADAILTAGTQSALFRVIHAQVKATGAAVSSGAGAIGLRGAHFACIWDSTGTANNCYGIQTNAVLLDTGSSVSAGTVQTLVGNNAVIGFSGTASGSGNAVLAYGYYVNTPQNTSVARTIGTAIGLYIEDMAATGITNAYAIDTGTGPVRFGSNLYFKTGTAVDTTLYGIGRNADAPNAFEYAVPASRIHKWTVGGTTEATLSGTAVDFQNNSITTTGGGSLTGTWTNLGTVTTIDINGGTLDGTIIGGSAPAAATVTSLSMAQLITWTGGQAITAGSYQCGRDADATNQLHCNIPTGATYEFSINDVPEFILSSTALDINNNALSNIGASGTDFANGGALVIGPDASASGTPALNLTQAGHTAITSSQPALNISPFTQTVNSGSTVTRGTAAEFAAPTFQGVAGGGTETATDIYTVYIAGPGIVGANLSNTAVGSLWVDSGDVRFDGLLQFSPQVVTVADDGAGTPALVTITPNSGDIQITCNDPHGCNVTMSETGAKNGTTIRLVNMSTNNVVFADTGGVSELSGGFTEGQYDSITMTYQSDRWIEDGRSNN